MTSKAGTASGAPAPDPRIAASLRQLPPGRRSVVMAVKRRGEAAVDELATDLGVTPSAVRQHLAALADAGLVEHEAVADGPGRPRHLHRLSPAAQALFPRAYSELTTELLSCLAEEDPDLLERAFERRR